MAAALMFTLAACAPEPESRTDSSAQSPAETNTPAPTGPSSSEDPAAVPTEPEPEAPTSAPTNCGWGEPAIAADLGAVPSGQEGELAAVLPGSWQHVAYDEGAGFTDDLTADIRYVFPSTNDMIYCQDVPGITDQAENRANVQLDGVEIVLPSPAPGYAVQTWSKDAMVWVNHYDGSLYLLQRR